MGAGQPKPIKPSNEFVSAPTNINRPTGEINVKEEHNNYPAFISFNGDENYDEARFSLWTIVAAIGATLFLIYIIKRIRDCHCKSVAKKEEIAKDAEKARDSRLEALAMTPIKWNKRSSRSSQALDPKPCPSPLSPPRKLLWPRPTLHPSMTRLPRCPQSPSMTKLDHLPGCQP